MAPVYKLHYFNLRARGEITRWIFALAGQEYEDHRIEFADWPAIKPTTPAGQLPVLEVDGKQLAQSIAIARYVARQFHLAGQTAWEEAQVDSLVDYIGDAYKGLADWITATVRKFPTADTLKEKYISTDVIPFLQHLESLLKSNGNGNGFFVGTKPTWGDLAVVCFEDELIRLSPTVLDKYPLLKAHGARVHELKGLKEWIAKQPPSIV